MGLVITIHVIVCALLIAVILIQRGRGGGGLAESFSDVESMFGTKTNTFLTRTTTVLSVLFFLTCLSLALLSVKQSRSLMRNTKIQTAPIQEAAPLIPSTELPKPAPQEEPKVEEKRGTEQSEEASQTE